MLKLYRLRKLKYVVVLIVFLVVLGIFVGRASYCSNTGSNKGLLENLKIFSEALHYIETGYVKPVSGKDLIYGAIKGMMQVLDPHSVFMPPDMLKELEVETKGEFGGVGMEITSKDDYIYVVSPIEDTPAWKAGIKAGDKIIKIDGQSTKGMSVMDAVKKLRGPKGTKVTITIVREGVDKPFDVTITRDIIKIKSVRYEFKEPGIAYFKIRSFQENTDEELDKAYKELSSKGEIKGIILDLRNNPGGLLSQAVAVAERFLPKGKLVVYTKGRNDSDSMRFISKGDKTYPYVPMVVLVNAGSASASEIVTGALKANGRAVVVGERTFGKGSVQSILPLSDGSAIKLTTAYYYTPDNICIEEKGITPDIEIPDNLVAKKGHSIREEELKKLKEGEIEEVEKKIKGAVEEVKEDYQLKVATSILRVMIMGESMKK